MERLDLESLTISTRVGYVYDERLLLHSELDHQEMEETPARVKAIHDHLTATGLVQRMAPIMPVSADPAAVSKVHSPSHVERLQDLALDYTDFFNVSST